MTEVEVIKHRINKVGDATGVLFKIDEQYVGLGELVEQLVRAILAERDAHRARESQ